MLLKVGQLSTRKAVMELSFMIHFLKINGLFQVYNCIRKIILGLPTSDKGAYHWLEVMYESGTAAAGR